MSKLTLVLLPGLDGSGALFERLIRALQPEIACEAVRYPFDATWGYAAYADYAASVIGSRRVVLLGESFSGPVAVMVADRLGSQVAGVILATTFVTCPWPRFLVRGSARVNPRRAPIAWRDAVLTSGRCDVDLSAAVSRAIAPLPREVSAARLRAVADVDVRAVFRNLKQPTQILHGRRDVVVPLLRAPKADRADQRVTRHLFDCGHMLLQMATPETAREIAVFYAKVSSGTT